MLSKSERIRHLRPLEPMPTGLKPQGDTSKKFRCLLFDIYGTLFVSGSGEVNVAEKSFNHLEPLEKLLGTYGVRETAGQALRLFFAAIRKHHEKMKMRGTEFPEVEIDRIWMDVLGFRSRDRAREFAIKFEVLTNPAYPMPHALELLSRCRRHRITMGIISNAQFYTLYLFDWFFHAEPESLGFDPDLLFLSYRLGCAKPSETPFHMAARALSLRGIPTESTLYIGNDMLNDIYPAKKSGFKTALFAGDARSLRLRRNHPLCRSLTADIVLTDLTQVVNYLYF